MRIEVGPVSAASAQAWIHYATDVLVLLRALPGHGVAPSALDAFASLLDEWRPLAQTGEPFRWASEEAPERVTYLIRSLYVAGTLVEREAAIGKAQLRPAAADEFHVVLVRGVLHALEREGDADAHFVQQIRNLWGIARRD